MNVLSLFDGMSCGQIALNRAGIKYDKYFACEIDKYAIQITQNNYPNTIQLGDVTKVQASDLPKIDLLIGGSPCQGFSFAGKQLAFDDPRSVLFFEYVRLLNELKPKYFLLENVRMRKEHEDVITKYLGIKPILINSSLLSAQNRVRLYWTNIGAEPSGLFGELECKIPQPKEKGILLKDILEKEVDKKYFMSEKMVKYIFSSTGKDGCFKPAIPKLENEKANCMTGRQHKMGKQDTYINVGALKFGRSEEAKQIRKQSNKLGKDWNPFSKKEVVGIDFEKMNCLPTHLGRDNLVWTQNCIQWDSSGKGHRSQEMRAYYQDSKSACVTTEQTPKVLFTDTIRRLTPIECERLQTVPDNYTDCVSDTRRYHALGNGWTVDVIVHILEHIK